MKTLQKLEGSKSFWFLFFTALAFFILRFPSLFEPYWYGDEGIYQVLGDAINNGRLLYLEIWDNKPPLLYWLYGIFSSDQFTVRLASLIFGILTVFVFYLLSRKIFRNGRISFISTALLAVLLGSPLLEGNIANAENFMLLPILGSALLVFNLSSLFLAGILLGIAFLFKIVAIFDFAAFFLFLFLIFLAKKINRKNILSVIKKEAFFFFGFSLPILVTALFFFLSGAFLPFFKAAFLANVGYVDYGNRLIIPQGFLILKLIILSIFVFIIFTKREKMSPSSIFILLWFGFSLFNAFFSQRPYTHYLLVLLPSISLLVGIIIEDLKLRKITFPLLAISLLLVLINFGVYGKTIFYYQNFISFVSGNKNVYSYYKFFDRRTLTDYELAMYVKLHTDDLDSIFIWGNNAQVYTLTEKLPPGRYAVAYHITSTKDGIRQTQEDLDRTKPKMVIIMPYMKSFPFALSGYTQKIIIDNAAIYERVF